MDYTMIIAIIGCVTGVMSLAIETAQFFANRKHGKFSTFDELNNFAYIKDKDDLGVVHCCLNLRVMNTGGRHILIQDVYMRRPGSKKNDIKDCVYPYEIFTKTPWEYCNGIKIEKPSKLRLLVSIPEGGVFEGVFAFTDMLCDCYCTDEPFVYPILCVVMADGSVKELTVQTIMSGDRSFAYVDSPNDNSYSMNNYEDEYEI